jgi:hypothetical protein
MARLSLTLEHLDPDTRVPGTYPYRVTCTSTTDHDTAIFVFHARSVDDALPGDQFECVASYQQMQEIPLDEPVLDGDTPIPYYRKSVVEFYSTDPEEVDDVWAIVQQDARHLLKAEDLADAIGVQTTVDLV